MGTDHDPDTSKPKLSRNARGKLARRIINQTIPAILRSTPIARRGVEAVELILDPPPPQRPSTTGSVKETRPPPRRRVNNDIITDQKVEDVVPSSTAQPLPPTASVMGDDENKRHNLSLVVEDTLRAAHGLHRRNLAASGEHHRRRLGILNMASPLRPGGGVLSGATSQEESLCRRTTLYPSLREEFYRLPEVGGIFTPNVLVFNVDFKDEREQLSQSSGHQVKVQDERKEWFYVDVITAAMLRFPDTGGGEETCYAEDKDRELVVKKMVAVMRILKAKGVEQVVLGAWGCGAYGNPIGEIARAWRKVLLGHRRRPPPPPGKGKANKLAEESEMWRDIEVVFAIKDARMARVFAKAFGPELQVLQDEAGAAVDQDDSEENEVVSDVDSASS
ncbi:hypothetical protein B0H66DRAFT_514062 [Apodospora peruviana]|uniref:Microbial-type PARG catalytic domain-containing protein n=1 Tax=Apodospora peruviana TaxID=516989 RepID=A0AAE0IAZ4_9PEZI|nr:hypothetical protein B0H66DRAFT_514062 [Apodospora peruviana]